jgi:hypothetical protein
MKHNGTTRSAPSPFLFLFGLALVGAHLVHDKRVEIRGKLVGGIGFLFEEVVQDAVVVGGGVALRARHAQVRVGLTQDRIHVPRAEQLAICQIVDERVDRVGSDVLVQVQDLVVLLVERVLVVVVADFVLILAQVVPQLLVVVQVGLLQVGFFGLAQVQALVAVFGELHRQVLREVVALRRLRLGLGVVQLRLDDGEGSDDGDGHLLDREI